MRNLIPSVIASVLAVVAAALAFSARQEAANANLQVTGLRLQLDKRLTALAVLEARVGDLEATATKAGNAPAADPTRIASDLRTLRSSTQEAFNAVGIALATLREDLDKKLPRPTSGSQLP